MPGAKPSESFDDIFKDVFGRGTFWESPPSGNKAPSPTTKALSPAKTLTVNNLASLLYDFLPGKAHSFARQDVSFAGIASSLRLQTFWTSGSKLAAVEHLLTNPLLHQEATFCPLIVTIVQKALVYRNTKKSPVTHEEVEQLNQFAHDLGFKIPELWDPKFLGGLHKTDNQKPEAQAEDAATDLSELKERLLNLTVLTAQHRGFEFERFLNEIFTSFHLVPRARSGSPENKSTGVSNFKVIPTWSKPNGRIIQPAKPIC